MKLDNLLISPYITMDDKKEMCFFCFIFCKNDVQIINKHVKNIFLKKNPKIASENFGSIYNTATINNIHIFNKL